MESPAASAPDSDGLAPRHRRLLHAVRSHHGRRKSGLILSEGVRCCREAVTRRPDWLALVVGSASFGISAEATFFRDAAARLGREFVQVADPVFADLAQTSNPQGILCVLQRPDAVPAVPGAARDPFVLVLDRVAEPGNMGAILRTAWAVGLHEVWLTQGATDPFGPKAIRAGMGAQFALDLREFADLSTVRDALAGLGYPQLWLAVPRGGVDCFGAEFVLPHSGLVIGNEATGVQACEGAAAVSIPMPGEAESLNAAQAATILLFEAVRRGLMGRG